MNVNFQKCALVFGAMFLLNACSVPVSKKMNNKLNDKTASQTNKNGATIVNNQSSIPARNYIEKKGMLFDGITIASSNNECVDRFNFLKEANGGKYQQYSNDYNKISRDYTFLNVNKNIMDKDSKELLSMTLSTKLDTLCSKVQFSGFQSVKEKVKALSSI
ncbi:MULTISPECIES: hypothetical protein [Arsenophonus]|jgi:hypothetical protein|uniref:hypothetical protein n=1 Tax=Arsenophonus TaxID=637 RepID=UPI0015D6E840|nr:MULTISPECIES: hypothetical protein [Arsenophonus]UBX28269.1 hypothetical protein LDL57_10505 [Arsenophonus apicola]